MFCLLPLWLALGFARAPLAPQGLALEGVVLAPDGAPAAGARVLLSTGDLAPVFFRPEPDVLADVRTAADGRFRLPVPDAWIGRGEYPSLALWVWTEAAGLTARRYEVKNLPVGEALSIRTARPAPQQVVVLDAERRAVPGAELAPVQYANSDVPPVLRSLLVLRTDEEGAATTEGWRMEAVDTLRVDTPPHGRVLISGGDAWLASGGEVVLPPVGQVRLALAGPGPGLPSGSLFALQSFPAPDPDRESGAFSMWGEIEVDLAALSSPATVPLVAGSIQPRLTLRGPPEAFPVPSGGKVAPGETLDVTIEWEPGVAVRGRVLDEATGAAVPDATVWISAAFARFPVTSGPDGTLSFRALSSYVHVSGVDTPTFHLRKWGFEGVVGVAIPPGAEGAELPDVVVPAGALRRGRVVNAEGHPVPGAWVFGRCQLAREGFLAELPLAALADAQGEFAIPRGPAGAGSVRLEARLGAARTRGPLEAGASDAPLELVLVENALFPVRGVVRDRRGAPVAGARVTVWRGQEKWPNRPRETVAVDGETELLTRADGAFSGGPTFAPDGSYAFAVASPEIEGTVSRWLRGEELAAGTEIVAPRLAALRGRLLDAAGQPMAGARVRVPADAPEPRETVTGADGRFALDGVFSRGGFVFASRADGAFFGRRFGGDEELAWTVGGAAAASASSPAPADRAAELSLARALANEWLGRARAAGDERELHGALRSLAGADPAAALARLAEGLLPGEWPAAGVRHEVVRALAARDADEALAVAESMAVGTSAVLARVDVADALPAAATARRREVLGRALAEARRLEDAAWRLVCLARIAGRLFDLGEADAGRAILEEGRPIAAALPAEEAAGYARGIFAEKLAIVDLAAALPLIEALGEEWDRERHFKNLALVLAGRDPAAAEEVLGRSRTPRFRSAERAVCHRMVLVDPDRARRLAARSAAAGEAYGNMALALADTGPALARELLEAAFQAMEARFGRRERRGDRTKDAVVAGSLLVLAERIAPARLAEYRWRAIALRPPPREVESPPQPERPGPAADGALAWFVIRTDPALARTLLAPVVALFAAQGDQLDDSCWRPFYAALVAVDPAWGVELARTILPARAAQTMAAVLAREGEQRERYVRKELLGLWVPGQEDLL
ncbi:MAG: carboxypeptidase-like regulatory domain-containing protein [Planctomycetota bacterium]